MSNKNEGNKKGLNINSEKVVKNAVGKYGVSEKLRRDLEKTAENMSQNINTYSKELPDDLPSIEQIGELKKTAKVEIQSIKNNDINIDKPEEKISFSVQAESETVKKPDNKILEKIVSNIEKPSQLKYKCKLIVLIVPKYFYSQASSYYLEFTRSIFEKLEISGYYGIMQSVSFEDIEEVVIPKPILEKHASGVIFLGQIKESYIKSIAEYGLPTVLSNFHYDIEKVSCITSDSKNAGYNLTKYLRDKGHERIGFVGDINALMNITERYNGYMEYLKTNNLEYQEDWLILDRFRNNTVFSIFKLPKNMPTAFICNTDVTAYNFSNFLISKGFNIPDDYSIVSFEHSILSEGMTPKITSWATDTNKIAEITVEKLMESITSKTPSYGTFYIDSTLIEKNSVSLRSNW